MALRLNLLGSTGVWKAEMNVPIESVALQLVAAGASDDDYAALFAGCRTPVFRLALLLTGDRHVADEVTAEVFARVLPKWRRGSVAEPLPYLRRAVVNELRSRFRRRDRETRALGRVAARPAPGEAVDRLELREPLADALRALPVRQRAVVVLRYHDDLSEDEVARTLGMAVGTVKSHASRGLEQLRRVMEEGR